MLKDILINAAEVTQIQPVDAATRAQLLTYINRAALEIYNSVDLPGSLWENFFCVDTTQGQITLPWFVDGVRGVRAAFMGKKITLHDMRPRYHATPWIQQPFEWRIRGRTPMLEGMSQTSQIIVTLAGIETNPVNITIAGATTSAEYYEETLTINAGSTQAITTGQYLANDPATIKVFCKDIVTQNNVVATCAADSAEIMFIPNRLLEARNMLLQVTDLNNGAVMIPAVSDNVEILYKQTYMPLYSDTDVFIDPKLDDAVVWKLREHWYSKEKDEYALKRALAAKAKCDELVKAICGNQESEAELVMQVAPNRFACAWDYNRFGYTTYGTYGNPY